MGIIQVKCEKCGKVFERYIDGNKHNNDPDNLMVFESQAEHARHHVELRKEVKNAL